MTTVSWNPRSDALTTAAEPDIRDGRPIDFVFRGWTPRAVVFDWDGLLMNTEVCWTMAKQRVFARRGLRMDSRHVEMTFGLYPGRSAEVLAPFVGEEDPAVVAEELTQFALQNVSKGVRAMVGAQQAVEHVTARVHAAVASNSPRLVLDAGIRQSGLAHALTATVAADEVAEPKPSPELYLAAGRILGTAPEDILVFEDSATGIKAATEAGMKVIAVSSRSALPLRSDGLASGADLQIPSFENGELLDWIDGWPRQR